MHSLHDVHEVNIYCADHISLSIRLHDLAQEPIGEFG
jgi:hypothetical protein